MIINEEEIMTIEEQREEKFNMLLEEAFSELTKNEVVLVRNFINRKYKMFKKLTQSSINSGSDRILYEYIRSINEEKAISCRIYNCEDITNFAKSDLEISFKIFNKQSYSLGFFQIKGSAPMKGCTLEEATQFMKLVDKIYKIRRRTKEVEVTE